MHTIRMDEFQSKIQKAQMICCPRYGYFVDFENPNPFKHRDFQFKGEPEFFSSKHAFGELLVLQNEGEIFLTAFVFDESDDGF